MTDDAENEFDGNIPKARRRLRRLAKKARRSLPKSSRETVVKVLGEGLRAIPIPFVGEFLANVVQNTLDETNPGPSLEDVLGTLAEMAESDSHFLTGLDQMGLDLAQVKGDVRELKDAQFGTAFSFRRPDVDLRWPIFDNQISGLLLNPSNGLVVLDEVHIEIEDVAPHTVVNLSVPAAPQGVIQLRADLSPDQRTYPLFELNGEPPHNFAGAATAERLVIDLGSEHNATYRLRLRFSYYDGAGDTQRDLVWPPSESPPVELPFACAPGWGRGLELLAVDEVVDNATQRLTAFADWLDNDGPLDVLDELGIPNWVTHGQILDAYARQFARWSDELPVPAPQLNQVLERLVATAARRSDP
jgi:hypothetical protein